MDTTCGGFTHTAESSPNRNLPLGVVRETVLGRCFRRLRLLLARLRERRASSKEKEIKQTLHPEIKATLFYKRRKRIIKKTSLSTIHEKGREEMLDDEGNITDSSISIETLFSTFSSEECMSSSSDDGIKQPRFENRREERILSSYIQPEPLDHFNNRLMPVVTPDAPLEDNLNELQLMILNRTKTDSQASVWSSGNPIGCISDIDNRNFDKTYDVIVEKGKSNSMVLNFRHSEPNVISVQSSSKSIDFSDVENVSQNASSDDEYGAQSSNGVKRGRRLYRYPSKVESKFEEQSEGQSSHSPESESNVVEVAPSRISKRVHFGEQPHVVIINSVSDTAIGTPDYLESVVESSSACDNMSEKEIEEKSARFLSNVLSRTLFSSTDAGQLDPRGSRAPLRCEDRSTVGVNENMATCKDSSKDGKTAVPFVRLSLPLSLYINMVDAEKNAILRECGSRYDHGDTFKSRDLVEQKLIQDRLIRLQSLKELLRRAREKEYQNVQDVPNVDWIQKHISLCGTSDEKSHDKLQKLPDEGDNKTSEIRSIYHKVKEYKLKVAKEGSEPLRLTLLPDDKIPHETHCKSSKNLDDKANSSLNPKSTTIQSVSKVQEELFWKNLSQGKIDDANNYLKCQSTSEDLSTWRAHSMCRMYDDDLWDLYTGSDDNLEDEDEDDDSLVIKHSKEADHGQALSHENSLKVECSFGHLKPDYNIKDKSRPKYMMEEKRAAGKNKKYENLKPSNENDTERHVQNVRPIYKQHKERARKEESINVSSKGKQDNKPRTNLPGFLAPPLGTSGALQGRLHSKEDENLQFFRYLARNPTFFRSGTPTPPTEEDYDKDDGKEHAIDPQTAADNLFFFRSVSRSSQFYSKRRDKIEKKN